MKRFFCMLLVCFVCICFLSLSLGFAADKKAYSTAPPAKIAKKWRIGFLQGGPYKDYGKIFIPTIEGLSELGWCEKINLSAQKEAGNYLDEEIGKMWEWLASNVKSSYIEFVADAFYSNNWEPELREKTKTSLLSRLKEKKDIDLMIAMGTWAGQDLANNEHSVPTIVISTTDALASGIIKSIEDSGYDHIHAHMEPDFNGRQIRALRDIIEFKKLGLIFVNDPKDPGYAPVPEIRKIAKELNFETVECHIPFSTDVNINDKNVTECARKIAPQIDVFHIIAQPPAINEQSVLKLLAIMNEHKIPTSSQLGAEEVKIGVLLTVTNTSFKELGMFHAQTIAKVMNGAKPRDLDQVFETPIRIIFNKSTAKVIDLQDDIYRLLLKVANEIYE